MERLPMEKGEVSSKISTKEPNDPLESMERWSEERDEASSSSSGVEMVQIEATMLENTSSMINQGLAIIVGNNSFSLVEDILQRDLRIEHSEATIWSRLDELGRITTRLMI